MSFTIAYDHPFPDFFDEQSLLSDVSDKNGSVEKMDPAPPGHKWTPGTVPGVQNILTNDTFVVQ